MGPNVIPGFTQGALILGQQQIVDLQSYCGGIVFYEMIKAIHGLVFKFPSLSKVEIWGRITW
jgi:hypothetical protein